MNPLRKIFGSKLDPFLLELREGHLWVVSLNQNSSEPSRFEEVCEEQLEERLNRNIKETAGEQTRHLFEYNRKGRRILPVFSSSNAGVSWKKKKPFALESQMFAFTQMRMQTLILFANLRCLPAATYVMLDPERVPVNPS